MATAISDHSHQGHTTGMPSSVVSASIVPAVTAPNRVAIGRLCAGADLHASDARFDSAANFAATRMGGYGVLTLHAHYALTPELGIGVRILNATDKRYEIAQGYNTAPRQYVMSVDVAFR